jgi:hypothetical protein
MVAKRKFCLAVVIGLGLLMASPQLAHSRPQIVSTGVLDPDDTPFTVTGYRDDVASTGVQLGWFDEDDLEAAQKRAAEYVRVNAGHEGVRAVVEGASGKKMTFTIQDRPKKKDFKEEKKAEPIPDFKPKKFVDVKPYNPPDKAKPESERKSYRVKTQMLNGFSREFDLDEHPDVLEKLKLKKGPYTLEEARAIMKQGEAIRDIDNAGGSDYKVRITIYDGSGAPIESKDF